MLKTLLLTIVLSAVFSLVATNLSAQAITNATLTGTWVLDADASVLQMKPAQKDKFASLAAKQQESIKASLQDRVYTFAADSTFKVKWHKDQQPIEQTGSWKIVGGDTLAIQVGKQLVRFNIIKLNPAKIILDQLQPGGQDQNLVSRLYFTKR